MRGAAIGCGTEIPKSHYPKNNYLYEKNLQNILYSMEKQEYTIKRKALMLNLNPKIFGTLAEIGGGQETARAFFQAGGASGTIAKTISAYDKTFSDFLYNKNKPGRYVSEDRLIKMLDKEYQELVKILADKNDTCFFAFANTVETLNFKKTNSGHGWLGVRFQLKPETPPNEVIIHVNLLENDQLLQQYSLGALGVNLLFACFHYYDRPNVFLQSLMENLDSDRVEINMASMKGPDLDYVDNRLLSVQLVKNGMTNATVFDRYGQVQQPSDMLYKKNVLAFRGSFRPITYVGFDMLKSSYALFKTEVDYQKENTLALCEMTINNLLCDGEFDERDFLDRVDILNGMGQNVMISNFREYYRLAAYFSNFNIKNLRLVLGVPALENVLHKKYYSTLKGGLLEAFGRLFTENLKLYVYPSLDKNGKIQTAENIEIDKEITLLYQHLLSNGKIVDIKNVKKNRLDISSQIVLGKIQNGEADWEEMVPKYISEFIKNRRLFGIK
ncbi:MAG: hypothetical protein JXR58_14055 [Bacteroidales bacterium]|nr:hypothetical protein [Bacteroidales bacterium]